MSNLKVNDLVKINQTSGTAKLLHNVGDIVQVIKVIGDTRNSLEPTVLVKRLEQTVSDITSDKRTELGHTFFMSELTKIGTVEEPKEYDYYLLGEPISLTRDETPIEHLCKIITTVKLLDSDKPRYYTQVIASWGATYNDNYLWLAEETSIKVPILNKGDYIAGTNYYKPHANNIVKVGHFDNADPKSYYAVTIVGRGRYTYLDNTKKMVKLDMKDIDFNDYEIVNDIKTLQEGDTVIGFTNVGNRVVKGIVNHLDLDPSTTMPVHVKVEDNLGTFMENAPFSLVIGSYLWLLTTKNQPIYVKKQTKEIKPPMSENERNELEQQLSDLLSNKRWLSQRITILNESLESFDQRKQKVKDELDEKMEQLAKYENSMKELIQKLQ